MQGSIDKLHPQEKAGFYKEYDTIALKTFKNGLKNEIMRQHAFLQEDLESLIKKIRSTRRDRRQKMIDTRTKKQKF